MVSRGLRVNDRNEALKRLSELNYYRLRGYWLAFEKDDAFIEGTTFEDITDVYDLDSKFRRWIWAALEPIEIIGSTPLHDIWTPCAPQQWPLQQCQHACGVNQ